MSQSIFRSTHVRDYTVFSNKLIAEPSLSFRAKGVLLYLISKPEDWKTRIKDIQKHGKEGRDAIRNAIAELTNAGYIVRRQVRGDSGSFAGTEYLVFESPQTENPKAGNPTPGKPDAENPTPGFPTLQSNDQQINEKQKNDPYQVMTTTTSQDEGSGGVTSFLDEDQSIEDEESQGVAQCVGNLLSEHKIKVRLSKPLVKACEGKTIQQAILICLAVIEKSKQTPIKSPQGMVTSALREWWAPTWEFVDCNYNKVARRYWIQEQMNAMNTLGKLVEMGGESFKMNDTETVLFTKSGKEYRTDYSYPLVDSSGEFSVSYLWSEIHYESAAA